MSGRPITLFTGQWADLPLERLATLAAGWGYDGLELAAGPHLDVTRAATDDAYRKDLRELLADHHLGVFAVSNHLVGQAVCDHLIDGRHRAILPERVWGDGEPEGVRRRAAAEMVTTAQAAARLGVRTVTGFTGSSIWHLLAMFPPLDAEVVERGFEDFAERWTPILDAYAERGVRFALEVHPGEIAYDYWTAARALDAVAGHEAFGFNFDPSHLLWQDVDPRSFLWDFRARIFHVHLKDTKCHFDGRNGRLGSHLAWGDPRRGWDFVSLGHGDVPWEACVRVLGAGGYSGPLSVEWEDAGMDRELGAADALRFARRLAEIAPAAARFDAAFAAGSETEEE